METIRKTGNIYVTESGKIIQKSSLYNYILPEDQVSVDYMENDTCKVLSLIKRQERKTIGVIRKCDGNCFVTLPLISEIYSYPITSHNTFRNGDIITLKINSDRFEVAILNYYGGITNFKNVKNAIQEIYSSVNESLLKKYLENLPVLKSPNYTDEYKDLTGLDTFSVDPEGSRDWDDCISLDESQRIVYVHIVDGMEIPVGSNIDLEGLNHSYTLYLVNSTFNAIPKEIINEKLSLKVGETRKVITIEIQILEDNTIGKTRIYPSIIINKRNYTYEEFNNILNVDPYYNWFLPFILKWKMNTFNLPSIKLNIKNNIVLFNLQYNNDISHKFIETLMILSNIIIANHLRSLNISFPNRYHPKNLNPTFTMERSSGNEILDAYLCLTQFRKAFYNIHNSGHFGLNLTNYTHFTSPIRRYIDVVNHRLLGGYVYDIEMLSEITEHINYMENTIEKISKWYWDLTFRKYLKHNWTENVTGYITGVYAHGIDFYITDWLLSGFIHVSDIEPKGKWTYDNDVLTLDDKKLEWGGKIMVFPKVINPYNIQYIGKCL